MANYSNMKHSDEKNHSDRLPCPRSYLAYATLISTFYYYYYSATNGARNVLSCTHLAYIEQLVTLLQRRCRISRSSTCGEMAP